MLDQEQIAFWSLVGVGLDALGGLYLAYDLFGSKRGLLRIFTKVATYGLVTGLGYSLVGRWFAIAGGLVVGPVLGLEFSWRVGEKERVLESLLFFSVRAAALGVAGALTINRSFGLRFGILTGGLMGFGYTVAATPNYPDSLQPGIDVPILVGAALRGLAVAIAALVAGIWSGQRAILMRSVEIALVAGSLSAVLGSLSPTVEWWADNLPARRLGAYGAALVVIGSLLQSMQYLVLLLQGRFLLGHLPHL